MTDVIESTLKGLQLTDWIHWNSIWYWIKSLHGKKRFLDRAFTLRAPVKMLHWFGEID